MKKSINVKRILFCVLIVVPILVLGMVTISKADTADEDDLYYYQFNQGFLFEQPMNGDNTEAAMSLGEYLERVTNSNTEWFILSDLAENYFVLSDGTVQNTAGPAETALKAFRTKYAGYDIKKKLHFLIAGFPNSPEHMKASAIHFEHYGNDYVYIYFLIKQSAYTSKKMYLHIKDGKLELDPVNKTVWWAGQLPNSRNFRITDSTGKYRLVVTENGLKVVGVDDTSYDSAVELQNYDLQAQTKYICYHTDGKNVYEQYNEDRRNEDLNGIDVAGWSEGKINKSPAEYIFAIETAQNYIPDVPYMDTLLGELSDYRCIHLYPIYKRVLHFQIVDEQGNPVEEDGIIRKYCPSSGGYVIDFDDGLVMESNCWAAFEMPSTNRAGGMIYTVTDAMFCTDDTYSEKDTSLDSDKYKLIIGDNGKWLLMNRITDESDAYLKIVVKKEPADVSYYGNANAFSKPADEFGDPSHKELTAYGTAGIFLMSEGPIIIPEFGDYDYAEYEYITYWYMKTENDISVIAYGETGEWQYAVLPDVAFQTDVDVWAVLRRTNVATKKYGEIESDHLTITIRPFEVKVMDANLSSAIPYDNLYVATPKNFKCSVSINGGEEQELNSSNACTYDPPEGGIAITLNNIYGFKLKVTENGTYKFTVRESDYLGPCKSVTITYKNLISEYDISIATDDVYSGRCTEDKILIVPGDCSPVQPYIKLLKGCYVNVNDTDWADIGDAISLFVTDNSEESVTIGSENGPQIGYSYTITENGSYQFKFVTAGGSELLSDVLEYTDIYHPVNVVFDMNGHGTAPASQTIDEGDTAIEPDDDPTEEGWSFGGWFEDADCETEFDFETEIIEETTIFAKWTKNPVTYTMISGADSEWTKGSTTGLVFVSDALFNVFDSVKVDDDTLLITYYSAESGSTRIRLLPTYLETLGIGEHVIGIISEDGSAWARFIVKAAVVPPVPEEYTVSFNMNGHGTAPASQTVEEGSTATKPTANPTAAGWSFAGWFVDALCETVFDFNTEITKDTTIFAKWTQNSGTPAGGVTPTGTVPPTGEPTPTGTVPPTGEPTPSGTPTPMGTPMPTGTPTPTSPADPTSPKTGDNGSLSVWITLLLINGGVIAGTTVWKKKQNFKN